MLDTYRKGAERPGWQLALSFDSVLEDSVKLAKDRYPYAAAPKANNRNEWKQYVKRINNRRELTRFMLPTFNNEGGSIRRRYSLNSTISIKTQVKS